MTPSLLAIAHHLPPDRDVVGVRRPILSERGGPSDLALPAAKQALERTGLTSADIDFIIFATMTPDVTFPGSACFLQDKLQCGTVGALDVRGQCCGFLMSLMIADGFLATSTYRNILLAAGEVHSSGLDYTDRGAKIARLYGDGAAVALLANREGAGLESVVCHSDGRRYDEFWCEFPSSRQHPVRMTMENFNAGLHFPRMDFDAVAEFGRRHLPDAVREAMAKAGAEADDVDLFVLSHVLPEVTADAAAALGLAADRWLDAGAAHGHLTAATLPVALSQALAAGRIASGTRVCLAACGAGFTWGAAVLRI